MRHDPNCLTLLNGEPCSCVRDVRGPAYNRTESKPWRWLESTLELQVQSYGEDPTQLEGDKLADFITWNYAAAVAELSEFLRETGWKPWAKGRGWVTEKALEELVDVGHFLANLLCAVGVTDDEWEQAYKRKQQKNRDRMATGTYEGRPT